MNSKIKCYATLAATTAITLPLACKKEANDPNIADFSINKKFNAVEGSSAFVKIDSLDFDNNGTYDLSIVLFVKKNDSVANNYLIHLHNNSQLLMGDPYMVKPLNPDDNIDSLSTNWQFGVFLQRKNLAISLNSGIGGQGDKLLGFRFRDEPISPPVNIYYGWMRVNLSADLKTLTIKDYAYQKTPNTAIKAGAK